jgi:hypothetical protein
MLSLYRDDPSVVVADSVSLTVADERTATAVLLNSLFAEAGIYYGFLTFGPGYAYKTDAVVLFDSSEAPPVESVANKTGLVVGIVIAILAITAVIIIVVVFMVWRHNEIRRRTSESAVEKIGVEGAQFVHLFFLFFFFFLFYKHWKLNEYVIIIVLYVLLVGRDQCSSRWMSKIR